jgi:hypothetical protein
MEKLGPSPSPNSSLVSVILPDRVPAAERPKPSSNTRHAVAHSCGTLPTCACAFSVRGFAGTASRSTSLCGTFSFRPVRPISWSGDRKQPRLLLPKLLSVARTHLASVMADHAGDRSPGAATPSARLFSPAQAHSSRNKKRHFATAHTHSGHSGSEEIQEFDRCFNHLHPN